MGVFKQWGSARFKKIYTREHMISHFLWFPINSGVFLAATYFSPSNIMSTHPRRVQYALGF
jgi:hypothetical protein